MEYKRFGEEIVLRVDKGEEILTAILEVADKEDIKFAGVTGIGASNFFEVGVLNLEAKKFVSQTYEGTYEIVSLNGNLSRKDGKAYLHLHANFASSNNVVGGHLTKAFVSATAEINIHIINGEVKRKYDENLGINLYKFEYLN